MSISRSLAELQSAAELVAAEEFFRATFWTDVRPMVREWRQSRKHPPDPLTELYESGYVQEAALQRGKRNAASVSTYA